MKRWFFACGLIMIIAGLITAMYTCSPREESTSVSVNNASEEWSVNANLSKGDFIWVHTTQGLDWPVGYFEVDEDFPGFGVLYVGVNITDPRGNFTLFLIKYGKVAGTSDQEAIHPLSILDINLTINGGGLNATPLYRPSSNSYWYVGGIAQFSGIYTFTIVHVWPSREYAPSTIDIRKYIRVTEGPSYYLISVGITVTAAGAALTWFSLKKKPQPKFRKRKS